MRVLIKCANYVEYDFYNIPKADSDMIMDWLIGLKGSKYFTYSHNNKVYVINRDLVCGMEVSPQ